MTRSNRSTYFLCHPTHSTIKSRLCNLNSSSSRCARNHDTKNYKGWISTLNGSQLPITQLLPHRQHQGRVGWLQAGLAALSQGRGKGQQGEYG
ncbi:hypothetical protein [Meiothermus sp.]|uniref:hypothetical protein n=1 Tax=Meiothermus sp. TaxID=1955249 RepID=UPI0026301CCB|nr:hypothetical protein [Meiothermus sp.]